MISTTVNAVLWSLLVMSAGVRSTQNKDLQLKEQQFLPMVPDHLPINDGGSKMMSDE